jgi:hypothetical protein
MARYRIHTTDISQAALEQAYGTVTHEGTPQHEWVNINAGMAFDATQVWLVETDESATLIENFFERDDAVVSWDRLDEDEDEDEPMYALEPDLHEEDDSPEAWEGVIDG